MTRFYRMDRLIGGPKHRKRIGTQYPANRAICFAIQASPPQFFPDPAPSVSMSVREAYYTPRKAAFGPNRVLRFWAYSRLTDAEASERLFTFLLDRVGIEESP